MACCFLLWYKTSSDHIILIGDKSVDIFIAFGITCAFAIYLENKKSKQAYISMYFQEVIRLITVSIEEVDSIKKTMPYAEDLMDCMAELLRLTKHMKMRTLKDANKIIKNSYLLLIKENSDNFLEYRLNMQKAKSKIEHAIRILINQ